ncbi:hypothetical protein PHMEG_00035896, partial [Phytophthora megakarya]
EAQRQEREVQVQDRLGGGNLSEFHDRASLKEDKETLETRFAKAKGIRAAKTSTALKAKLTGFENSANTKLDMEKREHRDRDEARLSTQDLLMMIHAFTKKS